jgi:uncharacterized repeat protein (TIGR03803 family)
VLHSFGNGTDGASPAAGLIGDGNGNLFGTTYAGGGSSYCENGCGTVFELAPDGTETLLYSFGTGGERSPKHGASPMAGVIMDKKGNLHGTTQNGGIMNGCFDYGCGTAFELKR